MTATRERSCVRVSREIYRELRERGGRRGEELIGSVPSCLFLKKKKKMRELVYRLVINISLPRRRESFPLNIKPRVPFSHFLKGESGVVRGVGTRHLETRGEPFFPPLRRIFLHYADCISRRNFAPYRRKMDCRCVSRVVSERITTVCRDSRNAILFIRGARKGRPSRRDLSLRLRPGMSNCPEGSMPRTRRSPRIDNKCARTYILGALNLSLLPSNARGEYPPR